MGKLVGAAASRASICFDCKKACGGCSWTEYDPAAGKIKWEPVSGWVAERVMYPPTSRWQKPSWRVLKCPEFEPDVAEKRKIPVERMVVCKLCGAEFVAPSKGRRVYCKACVPEGFTYDKNIKKLVPSVPRYKTKGGVKSDS